MWGARTTDGFMLMYKDLPGLQVVVHHVTITELIIAPNLHFAGRVWLLGNIRIPITVIFRVPFPKGQLPVRAVLLCPYISSLHLMDSVHL